MKRLGLIALSTLLAAIAAITVKASDPTAAYVVVDRVVFEPSADRPQRAQIWGTFSVATPGDRNNYLPPERGYFYFQLPANSPEQVRLEWRDLARSAGQRQIIGFGSRFDLKARLRSPNENPASPDVYTLASGLYRIRTDTTYPPMKALLDFSAR